VLITSQRESPLLYRVLEMLFGADFFTRPYPL
jgi:hypothetical protein